MRVALQISGQLRYFKSYYHMYKFQLLDTIKPDIYLTTWYNTNRQKIEDEGSLEEYCDIYSNVVSACAENFDDTINRPGIFRNIYDQVLEYKNNHSYRDPLAVTSMFYQRWLCDQYFQKDSVNYDVVIVGRSDLILSEPLLYKHLQLAIDTNSVIIPMGSDYEYGICDVLAFGPPKLIDRYCNLFECIPKYLKDGVWYHPEHILKYHLLKQKIPHNRISYTINLRHMRMT